MTFKFTKHFTSEFKKLLRKYHHLESDFDGFINNFETNHQISISIKSKSSAQETIDKAQKRNLIHANKAARMKSRMSKLSAAK
jgi:ribosomal protein S20